MDTTQKAQDTTLTPKDETPKGKESPPGQKEPAPQDEPKTHTDKEVERLVQFAKMETGRGNKVVAAERDTFKSDLTAKTSELDDVQGEREKLEARIEELSSKDPELNNLEKRDKELRGRERLLKDGIRDLDTNKRNNAARVKKAEDFERETSLQVIVEEYVDSDLTKLKDLCEILEATSEEQIRKVAETLWLKKPSAAPTADPSKPYTGVTHGGGIDFKTLSPAEKTKVSLEKLNK